MTMKHKWLLAVVAAAALGLAGCGGGGGSPQSANDGPSLEDRQMTQRGAIASAITMAQTAVAAVNDDSTDSEVSDAEMKIADARSAITAAADVPAAETAALTGQVDGLERELMGAKASRKMAMDDAADEAADKIRMASNAESMLVAEAIVGTGTRAGHNATADTNTGGSTAMLDLPAKVTSFEVDDKTGAIEVKRDTGVKLAAMSAESPGDGWTANRFQISAKSQGVLFTNRVTPKDKVTEYSYDVFFDVEGAAGTDVDSKISVGTPTAEGVLTISSTTTGVKAGDFAVPALLPPATTDNPTNKGPTETEAQEYSGSFFGVPGIFTCTSCEVTRDKEDALTFGGTTLTFKPTLGTGQMLDDLTVSYMTTTTDDDYLRFGYWMTTTETAGKVRHMIETFGNGDGYQTPATASELQGEATYNGAAAGIYVHKAGATDTLVVSDGEFVAAASLTATFGDTGDGKIADADGFSVTGKVTGFESTTGTQDLSGWTLTLQKANLGTRAADGTVSAHSLVGFSGETSGGAGTVAGAWSGSFFGNAGTATTAAAADDHPEAAIGEFNGHFANGHVAGAFGAEKD